MISLHAISTYSIAVNLESAMETSSYDKKLQKIRDNKLKLEEEEKVLLSKMNRVHVDSVVDLIKKYSLSLDDIKAALEGGRQPSRMGRKPSLKEPKQKLIKEKKSVAPKYKNPQNAAEFWTGRGRAPLWAEALRTQGLLETARIVQE